MGMMNSRLKNQAFFTRLNRLVFPLFYLGHWHKKTTTVKAGERNRFKLRVNSSDILLVWEIWKFRVYEDARYPIMPQDIVVDIGAHIGVFAVWAAQQAHQGAVYAYEASRANYDLLVENKRLNQAHNLYPQNLAVFDRPGQFDYFQPGGNGALGSLLQDQRAPKEIVTAITLENLFKDLGLDHVDYLKLDVEGAEYPILLQSTAETLSKIRMLVLEYHEFEGAPRGPRDLEKHLQSHGFQVSRSPGMRGQHLLFGTGIMLARRA
jgi:FkbM family methyltransferase